MQDEDNHYWGAVVNSLFWCKYQRSHFSHFKLTHYPKFLSFAFADRVCYNNKFGLSMNFDNRECERFSVDTFTAEAAKHAEFILSALSVVCPP